METNVRWTITPRCYAFVWHCGYFHAKKKLVRLYCGKVLSCETDLGNNELSSLRRQVMNNKSRIFTYCNIAISIFLFTSCATTKLTTVWKDESFHKTIRKIVVAGAFRQTSIRNFLEDEFV